jgi:hypothetical protein
MAAVARELGVSVPDSESREAALREAARKLEWDEVASISESLKAEAESLIRAVLRSRWQRWVELWGRARELGLPNLPDEKEIGTRVEQALSEGRFLKARDEIEAAQGALDSLRASFVTSLRQRARELARWAGNASPEGADPEAVFSPAWEALESWELAEGIRWIEVHGLEVLPGSATRREGQIRTTEQTLALAAALGLETREVQARLERFVKASPLDLPTESQPLEEATNALRDQCRQEVLRQLTELSQVLRGLEAEGTDVAEPLAQLARLSADLEQADSEALAQKLPRAHEIVETIVVAVVASYVDEIRPRVAQAKQFSRDVQSALNEMNQAREHLRGRQYARALVCAQRALEIAEERVSDIESVRVEIQELRQLLRRLGQGGFPVTIYERAVEDAEARLNQGDLEGARGMAREAVRSVGREAVPFFQDQLASFKGLLEDLDRRGWGSPELRQELSRVAAWFQEGRFPEVAEGLAAVRSSIRAAVSPHLSQRLEELGRLLEELTDETSVSRIRGLMADADVTLKVRNDPRAALGFLDQASAELRTAALSRAEVVARELEEEIHVLQTMGVETAELSRDLSQVREIFRIGDFLRASQASQDLRARLLQQQLVRAEEAVSRAKLSIVEVSKMGLEPASVRGLLTEAQELIKKGRFGLAFDKAEAARREASQLRVTAQRILDSITRVAELLADQRRQGQSVEDLREYAPRIATARMAYQAMDFAQAEKVAEGLRRDLETLVARREGGQEIARMRSLFESARAAGLAEPDWGSRLETIVQEFEGSDPVQALQTLENLRGDILQRLRPALSSQIDRFEEDLRAARMVGMDTQAVEARLREAQRRLAEAYPAGVAESLEETRREFFQSRAFLEQALKALKAARDAVNEAEVVRADGTSLSLRLEEGSRRIEARDYAGAIQICSEIQKEAQERSRAHVTKALAGFQALVTKAKMEGALTMAAENLLARARTLLDQGKPVEALQVAAQSETELERVELQHSMAQSSLLRLEERIEAAVREHLVVPGAREDLERARDLFANGRYADVLDSVLAATDRLALQADLRKRARDAISKTRDLLEEYAPLDLDVTPLRSDLERAEALLEQGEYGPARSLAMTVAEGARNLVETRLYASLEEVRHLARSLSALGPEGVPAVQALIDKAEEQLRQRQWLASQRLQQEARDQARRMLEAGVSEVRTRLETVWKSIPPEPGEDRERLRQEVDQKVQAQDTEGALRLLHQALEEAQTRRISRLEQETRDLERSVLWGEKLGVDTTPVMELFSEARLNLESRNLEVVSAGLAKAREQLALLLGSRLEERLRDLEGELAFAKEGLNVSVGPVESLLKQVEDFRQRHDPVSATELLLKAEEELNERKARHRELTNLSYLVDAALAQASERKVSTGRAKELLAEALRLRATDYTQAIEMARSALTELQRLLSSPPGEPSG